MAADFLTPGLLDDLRLVADTAALVLIWLVQLVVYPAFAHYQMADFRRWHPLYTRRVTYVVMPIMLFQVALYAGAMMVGGSKAVWANIVLIAGAWGMTFLRAVPLHTRLDGPEDHLVLTASLLRVNWVRTVLWTLVWIVTVTEVLA